MPPTGYRQDGAARTWNSRLSARDHQFVEHLRKGQGEPRPHSPGVHHFKHGFNAFFNVIKRFDVSLKDRIGHTLAIIAFQGWVLAS